MNGVSGLFPSMRVAADSMGVHGIGMQVSAHNVANVSTDGFAPRRAVYATGTHGQGVAIQTVQKLEPLFSDGALAAVADMMPASTSGTELARELPQMISTQRGFEAQAATIRSADDMLGYIIDIKA